jgi:hypothetical protein
MKLQHKYTWLWKQSGLLDELAKDNHGNLQPLSWYAKQLPKVAKTLATHHPIDQAYANYYGWLGEVLAEFWLKKFGHLHSLQAIMDTSAAQFNRGFDFAGSDVFAGLPIQVQVKMKSDQTRTLTKDKLFTFMDEGEKANVLPQYLILMIPSFFGKDRLDVISYKDDFQLLASKQFLIITGRDMQDAINSMPSATPGRSGTEEFLLQFAEAIK